MCDWFSAVEALRGCADVVGGGSLLSLWGSSELRLGVSCAWLREHRSQRYDLGRLACYCLSFEKNPVKECSWFALCNFKLNKNRKNDVLALRLFTVL